MKAILTLLIALTTLGLSAQEVQKKILIEHFTNTRCGICASKNPAFFNTIDPVEDVIHVAYHPSSPYSSCVLSQHNPSAQDSRTNYYNIFGGTPRVVVNGSVVAPMTPMINSATVQNADMETSPYAIEVTQVKNGNVLESTVEIRRIATTTINNANLIVIIGEETLNYNAPNGENVHHDVFRTFANQGDIALPNLGDTATYIFSTVIDAEWTDAELQTTAFLQNNGSKEVYQAGQSAKLANNGGPTAIADVINFSSIAYPNPATNTLLLNNEDGYFTSMTLYNIIGKSIFSLNIKNGEKQTVDISTFERGNYFINWQAIDGEKMTQKVVFR